MCDEATVENLSPALLCMLAAVSGKKKRRLPLGSRLWLCKLTPVYAQTNDSSDRRKAATSRLSTEIASQITNVVAAVAIPGIVEVLLLFRTERIGARPQKVLQH